MVATTDTGPDFGSRYHPRIVERYGNGYPDGLSGQEIPIEARIVSACDAFNAMTTTRSYRRAMPTELAITEMEACAGTQFDPDVVAALLRVVSPVEAAEERSEPIASTSDLVAPELAI